MSQAAARTRASTTTKPAVVARDLRVLFREIDADLLAPRVAALTYLVAGLLALVLMLLMPGTPSHHAIQAMGLLAFAFGACALAMPWHRWDPRMQLVLPAFAFVLFAWGGVIGNEPLGSYLAMLPLPFVYIGFTQRPGTAALLAPMAAIALVVAGRFSFGTELAMTLLFALPMSVLVGEALALAQWRRNLAERRVERLLEAVRVLARVDNTRRGAHLVAALSAELLGAEAVSVLLEDRPASGRYLNRAFFGHPTLADSTPLLLDALGSEGALRAGTTRFISDPAQVRRYVNAAACVRSVAIVPLPGTDLTPIGVVVAMWTSNRRRLSASARQAAELLSAEAGRMFQRIRDAEALTKDAETDALTELSNRRTFSRALSTLQAGDAVVIVDIDFFKRVNDRFGHQAGDETLQSLAGCLRDTARQVDCVSRYGGEEFALVLPEAGVDGARAMLRRVRRAWGRERRMTSFSAGIAVHCEGRTPRDTLALADEALYAAKEGGRDRDVVAPLSVDDCADVVDVVDVVDVTHG